MTKPRDTSKDSPIVNLAVTIAPGGIEAQEAAGQAELLASTSLPTRIIGGSTDADFEALGFTFGEPNPADPLFRPATLPKGWTMTHGGSSYWTKILDERGLQRVSIFYKAAFYDRSAHMILSNLGWTVARDYIDADIEELPDGLTADELLAVRKGAQQYLNDAEGYEHIYTNGDRARALIAQIEREQG
jgi:hypothetical protein